MNDLIRYAIDVLEFTGFIAVIVLGVSLLVLAGILWVRFLARIIMRWSPW